MKVYLDDVRETPEGWERTYTVAETIEKLKTGMVTELSLDHDLGRLPDGTYEPDGYEVLVWLEKEVKSGDFGPLLPTIYIHSANPVGRARMWAALRSIRLWIEENYDK